MMETRYSYTTWETGVQITIEICATKLHTNQIQHKAEEISTKNEFLFLNQVSQLKKILQNQSERNQLKVLKGYVFTVKNTVPIIRKKGKFTKLAIHKMSPNLYMLQNRMNDQRLPCCCMTINK